MRSEWDSDTERLYEGFMGKKMRRTELLDVPNSFAHIGKALQICYSTIEDKKVVRYIHQFDHSPRLLVANSRNGEGAALILGDFRFTSRGFIG